MRAALGIAMALIGCGGVNRPDPVSVKVQSGGTAAGGEGLRVVTFNVHGQSAAAIARALAGDEALRDADVLLLQEVEERPRAPVCAAIGRQLGMAWAFAPGYGMSGGGSHGVAVLSRFPLGDVEVIELPRNHTVVNSARRVALGATVQSPGGPVRVYSVHLDNRIQPDRRLRQLAPVIEAAARQPIARVIVGGDLNTSPFQWLGNLVPLPVGGQIDPVEAFVRRNGYATPAAGSGQTSPWLAMRLDAIYVRGLRALASGVERDVRISDHFPLWVEFASERSERATVSGP